VDEKHTIQQPEKRHAHTKQVSRAFRIILFLGERKGNMLFIIKRKEMYHALQRAGQQHMPPISAENTMPRTNQLQAKQAVSKV